MMVRYMEREHPIHGRCLFFDNGVIEVGVPLTFGLRVCHLSFVGQKNVFFEQPREMTDLTTPDGWRLRGGHRLWLAPESQEVYAPDNEPITCLRCENGVTITQREDPRLHVVKQFTVTLDENRVRVTHRVTNMGESRTCALWSISVMAPGGVEHIPLAVRANGCAPSSRFSIWSHTTLGDPRADYSKKDEIVLTHMPIDARYKLGVAHPAADVRYELPYAVFKKHYDWQADKEYPDGNVSYETFLCRHMTEVESLSPLYTLATGESATHDEIWTLEYKG